MSSCSLGLSTKLFQCAPATVCERSAVLANCTSPYVGHSFTEHGPYHICLPANTTSILKLRKLLDHIRVHAEEMALNKTESALSCNGSGMSTWVVAGGIIVLIAGACTIIYFLFKIKRSYVHSENMVEFYKKKTTRAENDRDAALRDTNRLQCRYDEKVRQLKELDDLNLQLSQNYVSLERKKHEIEKQLALTFVGTKQLKKELKKKGKLKSIMRFGKTIRPENDVTFLVKTNGDVVRLQVSQEDASQTRDNSTSAHENPHPANNSSTQQQ